MLVFGVIRAVTDGPGTLPPFAPATTRALTFMLIIRAFSSGCTALTGIEAISNGVQAFRSPEAKNAGRTLIVLAFMMGTLFVGSIGLTQYLAVIPGTDETILSALTRRILGEGAAYFVVQTSILLILVVATNTAFAGFPRLAAILANDGLLPRQLKALGDRLVFNNGIMSLAMATGILIILFKGDTHVFNTAFCSWSISGIYAIPDRYG